MPFSSFPAHRLPWQKLSHSADQLGESPFWLAGEQALYWVDIPGRAIRRWQAPQAGQTAREQHWPLDEEPGCIAPAAAGGLIVALRSQVAHFSPQTGALRTLAKAPYQTATERFNDGRCDPQGRFWAGTLFEPKTSAQAGLYCLTRTPAADGWQMVQHLGGNLTANGLAFSPDARQSWWSNTPEHVIFTYPFDAALGRFGEAREFHRFPRRQADAPYGGRPDGACVDCLGNYWVAMYEGGRVLQFDPHGRLLCELHLPTMLCTMACLGGSDLRTLFVTTASRGLDAQALAAQPWAGHVLALDLNQLGFDPAIRGLPVAAFREDC